MNQRPLVLVLIGYVLVCAAACLVAAGLLPVEALFPLCAAAVGLTRAGCVGRRWK